MSAITFILVTLLAGSYMGVRKVVLDYPAIDKMVMQYGAYLLAVVYSSIVTIALHDPIRRMWSEVKKKAEGKKRVQTAQA